MDWCVRAGGGSGDRPQVQPQSMITHENYRRWGGALNGLQRYVDRTAPVQ